MSNRLVANSSPLSHPISQTQPNSSTSSKLRALFITQKSNPVPPPQNEVLQRHSELNSYIDDLDEKIQKIVQHNEAELLFAYRNHLDRVRNEMTEFKEETVARISDQANHQFKIEMLQKQLTIFRQEALKLFQKAVEKDKLIEELRLRLSQFRSQKNYMDDTLKSLIKRNKQLQATIQTYSISQDQTFRHEYLGKIQVNSFASLGISTHKKLFKREKKQNDRTPTTNSKMFTQSNFNTDDFIEDKEDNLMAGLRQFSKRLKLRLGYLQTGILQNIIDSAGEVYSQLEPKRTKILRAHVMSKTGTSLRSKSYTCDSRQQILRSNSRNHHQDYKIYQSVQVNQLKDYFRNCIQTVKREIARRKKINSINFFKDGGPITLEQFKKIDFFRLLELFFGNQKVIRNLHSQLFDISV